MRGWAWSSLLRARLSRRSSGHLIKLDFLTCHPCLPWFLVFCRPDGFGEFHGRSCAHKWTNAMSKTEDIRARSAAAFPCVGIAMPRVLFASYRSCIKAPGCCVHVAGATGRVGCVYC